MCLCASFIINHEARADYSDQGMTRLAQFRQKYLLSLFLARSRRIQGHRAYGLTIDLVDQPALTVRPPGDLSSLQGEIGWCSGYAAVDDFTCPVSQHLSFNNGLQSLYPLSMGVNISLA